MPLGLGKGLQNSINSWVNVNSNHVVFPQGADSSQPQHSSQSDDASRESSSSSLKGRMMNRSINPNRDLMQKHYASNSTMGSTRTGTSTSSMSTQLGSIIEKSNQQQPRKLKRSNSQSDLIKEKLAKREQQQQQRNMTRRSSALSHRSSMESIVSRRGSMESVASNSSAPVNTGQYVNEIAFKRQLAAQQQLQQQGSSQRSLMSKNSLTKKTSPNRNHTSSAPPSSIPQRSNSPGLNSFKSFERRSSAPSRVVNNSQNVSSGASVASVNSSTIMTTATAPSLIQPLPSGCEHTDCEHCVHLSQRIFALEEDLEALRGNYLNTEYICKSCTRNKNMSSNASVASGRTANSRSSRHSMGTKTTRNSQGSLSLAENVVLAEASRRLILLTSRHKRDIERLSKEKERFQKDMHFKLKNFTMMFKDVEKESLEFKDQVEKVNKDVTVVKGERDALSSELEILKARVAMYEKQEAENEEIRRLLRENQNETLDIADRAIHERDVIIEELTARLQEATSLLESKET